MSVDLMRERLKQEIVLDEPFSVERARRVDRAAMDWFHAYKEWERDDKFLDAVRDKRMCISQRGMNTVIGDGNPAYLGVKDHDKQGKGTQKVLYKELTYRTGVDSVKDRLNPSNFGSNSGPITRTKYKLGLHDLSASLMNPDKPTIKEQARWDLDGSKKDWPIIFMPLPPHADIAVYRLLGALHKEWRKDGHDLLITTLDHIRRRFTRVQLAQDSDMGAGLINMYTRGSGDPNRAKFRYGMADVQSVEKSGSWVPVFQKGISVARRAKALEYQSILSSQQGSSNEIVVAFRQHASPRFPIITQWDGTGCKLMEASPYIKDSFIPDRWATTVEK